MASTNPDPIQEPPPQGVEHDDTRSQNWRYNLTVALNGNGSAKTQQELRNRISGAKVWPDRVSAFFINDAKGDANFDASGVFYPYIGPAGQLIVPQTVIASKRDIKNIGALRAFQTAPQLIPNAIGAFCVFPVVATDEDSAYNNGTGIYTVKQAGVFHISVGFGYATAVVVAASQAAVSIYVNGVIKASGAVHASFAFDIVPVCSLVIKLAVGDTIRVATFHNFGVASNSFGVEYANYFSLAKVS